MKYQEGKIFPDLFVFIDSKIINNTYVLLHNQNAIIIDPSFNYEQVMKFLDEKHLIVKGVLITHGHDDHTYGAQKIVEKYKCLAYVNNADYQLSKKPNTMYFNSLGKLKDHQVITFNKTLVMEENPFGLKVLHTPGHTPGSSCYYTDKYVFTGDHIFDIDIGRTDFDYSNSKLMEQSIKAFVNQFKHQGMWIFPGHEEWTLVDNLEKINPYASKYFKN